MIFDDYDDQWYLGMDGAWVFSTVVLWLRKNPRKTSTRKLTGWAWTWAHCMRSNNVTRRSQQEVLRWNKWERGWGMVVLDWKKDKLCAGNVKDIVSGIVLKHSSYKYLKSKSCIFRNSNFKWRKGVKRGSCDIHVGYLTIAGEAATGMLVIHKV